LASYAPVVVGGRGRSGRVWLALAVVAVIITAAFGFSALSGSGDGAGSPEEAVKSLFSAMADEDAIGVLESFAPAERSVLRPTVEGLNDQFARLGIINKVDLGHVPGFDITVDGLRVSSTEVASGISRVQLDGGTIGIATQPDRVPVGDVLKALIEANGGEATVQENSDSATLGESPDEFLVAVKEGGGWFVSYAFTIAEQARNAAGADMPSEADAVVATGSTTPEGAVRDLLDALAALDVRGVIAMLPPDEMRALQRYAPLFLADAEDAIAQFKDESGFKIEISNLDLQTSDADGGQLVTLRGGQIGFDIDGGHVEFNSGDGCVTVTPPPGEGEEDRLCAKDIGESTPELASGPFGELASRFADAATGLVVVERDGKWFVSPLRTTSNLIFTLLGTVQRSDLEPGGPLYDLFTGGYSLDSSGFGSSSSSTSS
jgi:hypothetical protein